MTTSSDVQANPGDQQTQPDPNQPAAGAQQQQQPEPQDTGPQFVDPDDTALAEAQAAVEAEEAAAGDQQTTQSEPGQPNAQTQPSGQQPQDQQRPQGGQQQQPAEPPTMIPIARLNEELSKRHTAELDAARWRGIAEARQQQQPQPQGGQQQQPQQTQQPTADQRLAGIKADRLALAQKFDNGEITYAELTAQQDVLADKEQVVREELLLAKVKPAAPAKEPSDLYLEDRTNAIAAEHPWVDVFEQVGTDIDWKYVRDRAQGNLIDKGIDVTTQAGKLALREEAAALMDELGPHMLGAKATAKGIAIPGQQQPKPGQQQQPPAEAGTRQQQPPLSPIAAIRKGKLGVEAGQPPDLARMNGTTGDASQITDAAIESMGEDAYDKMSDAQRAKLLGISEL
jgi:hypothetical protein